jgi:predicted Fe-Mo cluster-binding NifX family protein
MGVKVMKVAVSAQGPLLSSAVDGRFGRAAWFIIADTEKGEFQAVKNEQNLAAAQGAGVQSAQLVVNRGARAVLTGHCGPKAFKVLSAAGIPVYLGTQGSVSDAIEQFRKRQLTRAAQADVEGHWA